MSATDTCLDTFSFSSYDTPIQINTTILPLQSTVSASHTYSLLHLLAHLARLQSLPHRCHELFRPLKQPLVYCPDLSPSRAVDTGLLP